jgi:hypothetical protein
MQVSTAKVLFTNFLPTRYNYFRGGAHNNYSYRSSERLCLWIPPLEKWYSVKHCSVKKCGATLSGSSGFTIKTFFQRGHRARVKSKIRTLNLSVLSRVLYCLRYADDFNNGHIQWINRISRLVMQMVCPMTKPRNANWRGKLNTVDLLIRVARFIKRYFHYQNELGLGGQP